MSAKNLCLVIVAHQGYIRHLDDEKQYAAENNILFSAISQTYLPLLNLFNSLKKENCPFKLSLVLSPVLCSLLDDEVVKQQYIEWLDARIAFGESEISRLSGQGVVEEEAKKTLESYRQNKIDFMETYGQNLLRSFSSLAKKGCLELLATAGSYAFLPHYADLTEVVNAQVETGLYSHRHYFGTNPDGFWLPYMGFVPGLDTILRSYGINYTIVDTHALLFSKSKVEKGIFAPVRTDNSLILLGRDCETPGDLTGEEGFMANPVYKDVNKDAGFELSSADLSSFLSDGMPRVATGYRYWSKEDGAFYNEDSAKAQAEQDAATFIAAKKAKLDRASELVGDDVNLVCTFDAELFGQSWAEGISFLETILKNHEDLELTSCSSVISNQFIYPKIQPYPSAASGTGFGEDLLDSSNGWLLQYTRKMGERMVDLAGRFPSDTGLKARLLNLGAKELMIAQGAEWAKMLHEENDTEYVSQRFKESIRSFLMVFDALGSNTVSTEWLTDLERRHPLFPWMNYRIFSRKM